MADATELREALEIMCVEFSCWSEKDGGGLWCGGLSALEEAFRALGWSDPHPRPDLACQEPECSQRASCGYPYTGGYKWTCHDHYKPEAPK